jgi:hypothetical protein
MPKKTQDEKLQITQEQYDQIMAEAVKQARQELQAENQQDESAKINLQRLLMDPPTTRKREFTVIGNMESFYFSMAQACCSDIFNLAPGELLIDKWLDRLSEWRMSVGGYKYKIGLAMYQEETESEKAADEIPDT